ncbi:lipopolysaccharide assembly protein LapB [Geobacter sp. AOG1]|uniref:tetratricopeptide repeat protein n=1 Tax=Geobacter sp. AOG1 TaxID=1566346 RepID=UPI001CC80F69|nr:tetratricopeptide repeat protein [Geobacter sp. AOG1]
MSTNFTKLKPHLVPAIVLILLTLVVYGQVLNFDFLSNWDDYQYVTSNPDIRGFSAINLVHIFSSSYVGNYAPVHLLSYMLDYQLAGLNPAWFHGVNVAFHTVNGLLFSLLVYRLTGKPAWAFVSAAVFLLHPVQVESVAWVSQRKNLLAMFFSLCSFLAYLSYRQRTGEGRQLAYILSVLSLLLALFAKSIAVIMPFVFLLYDFYLEQPRRKKGAFVDKIPYIVTVAVASGIAMVTQSAGGGSVDFFEGNIVAKFLTMLTVLTRYVQILLWPVNENLNAVYIFFVKNRLDGDVAVALLLVTTLCLTGIYLWRRERCLFFGFALFFLGLIPVAQIVPLSTLMNDRYLYFPMLGAAWMVGGLLSLCHDRFFPKRTGAALVVITCLLIPYVLLSYQRTQVWQNAIALWSDVVKKLPTLKDQRATLAAAYIYDDKKKEALATYEELFALKREFADPHVEQKALLEAANLYMDEGSLEKASPLLLTLTRKFPDYPRGFLTLGRYYVLARNLPEAEKAYHKALLLEPASPNALISLGNICLATGRVAEARAWYRKCYENGGNSPDLQFNLARVEAREKNYEAALNYLAEALKLGYRNLDAINNTPELAPLRRLPSSKELFTVYFGHPW